MNTLAKKNNIREKEIEVETAMIEMDITSSIRESRNHPGLCLEKVAKAIAVNLDEAELEVLICYLNEIIDKRANKINIREGMIVVDGKGLKRMIDKGNHYLKVKFADCPECKGEGSLEIVVSGFVNSKGKEKLKKEKIAGYDCSLCDYQKKVEVNNN